MNEDFRPFLTIPGYVRLHPIPSASPDTTAVGASVGQHLPRMASARQTSFTLTCSSGMFTHLQLKPRVAFYFGFTGWSAWLTERAVSHAALIRDHATGFVPIGIESIEIEHLQPSTGIRSVRCC